MITPPPSPPHDCDQRPRGPVLVVREDDGGYLHRGEHGDEDDGDGAPGWFRWRIVLAGIGDW